MPTDLIPHLRTIVSQMALNLGAGGIAMILVTAVVLCYRTYCEAKSEQ